MEVVGDGDGDGGNGSPTKTRGSAWLVSCSAGIMAFARSYSQERILGSADRPKVALLLSRINNPNASKGSLLLLAHLFLFFIIFILVGKALYVNISHNNYYFGWTEFLGAINTRTLLFNKFSRVLVTLLYRITNGSCYQAIKYLCVLI